MGIAGCTLKLENLTHSLTKRLPCKNKLLLKKKKENKLGPPLKKKFFWTPSQNSIGPTLRIGQEIQCLLYAGFFLNPCSQRY